MTKRIDLLAIYQEEFHYGGVYVVDKCVFNRLIRELNCAIRSRQVSWVMRVLKQRVPQIVIGEEQTFEREYVYQAGCLLGYIK